jgi:hypothetical protein
MRVQVADDVFHHHHRAFHHHAEIERAERKQVGGNIFRSRQMEANSSENGMVSATINAPRDIAEKDEQDHRHQNDALGQVVQHRVGGEVHQVRCGRETERSSRPAAESFVQLVHLGVNRFERGVGVGAFAQQNDAGNHVVVVDDFAVRGESPCQSGPAGSSRPAPRWRYR